MFGGGGWESTDTLCPPPNKKSCMKPWLISLRTPWTTCILCQCIWFSLSPLHQDGCWWHSSFQQFSLDLKTLKQQPCLGVVKMRCTPIYILKNQQVNNNNNVNHYHYSVCEYAQPAGVNIKQPFLSVIDSTRYTQQESVEPPNKGHFESVGFCPLLEGCPATT